MIKLTLPWPPTLNTYWRRVGNRTLISAAGRRYREEVAMRLRCREEVALRLVLKQRPTAPPGRLAVAIDAYPPDRRVRDLDNLFKATLDALKYAGFYADDGLIDALSIVRQDVRPPGKLVIRVLSHQADRCCGCGTVLPEVML